MYFDLVLFKDSLFMFSNSITFNGSSFIKVLVVLLCVLLVKVLKVLDNIVSSAYTMTSNLLLASQKSFVYIMNKSGPRIQVCAKPVVISKVSDFISSISVYCFLFVK